jgi:hypothetical protein
MNKPELLVGEAKSFEKINIDSGLYVGLEYVKSEIERITTGNIAHCQGVLRSRVKDLQDHINKITKLKQFYTQTFTPNMIIELFDGWERNDECLQNFYLDINEKDYWWVLMRDEDSSQIEIRKCETRSGNEYKYKLLEALRPQTLNDFISDCNRVDIKLIWKD